MKPFSPLANGVAVLEALARSPEPMGVTALSEATGIGRATVRRLVHTLQGLGYVRFDGRVAASTAKCMALVAPYAQRDDLAHVAAPLLDELVATLGETVSIAVLDRFEAVYVCRVKAPGRLQFAIEVGTRLPAHACSTGRVLLAEKPASFINAYFAEIVPERYTDRTITEPAALRRVIQDVATRRLAEVVGEVDETIYGLAVPILATAGVIGALGLTATVGRADPATRERFVRVLNDGARRIANGTGQ